MVKQLSTSKDAVEISTFGVDNEMSRNTRHKAVYYIGDKEGKLLTMTKPLITPYKKDDWIKNG
jgi:hypothetical protein